MIIYDWIYTLMNKLTFYIQLQRSCFGTFEQVSLNGQDRSYLLIAPYAPIQPTMDDLICKNQFCLLNSMMFILQRFYQF